MLPTTPLMMAAFAAATSFVLLLFLLAGSRKSRVDRRLGDLAAAGASPEKTDACPVPPSSTLPPRANAESRIDKWTSRRMRQQEKKNRWKQRIEQAGFYKRRAINLFFVVRLILAIVPVIVGVLISQMGHLPLSQGLIFGGLAGLAGTLAPTFWLDHVKKARQTKIRRALPDALDVMVICLDGGLSLSASFSRVAGELATAHPMLAVEFKIIERQVQMGQTIGESVRGLANRFDLEELRSMASLIAQAERIGASVAGALRVFGDTLRQKRHQRAEEMAHKAAVKLLFPTIFFIFPGIFVVILGPAAIRIYQELITGVLV